MADYIYYYGENTIKVSIRGLSVYSLYVNGELQVKRRIWTWTADTKLQGKLSNGEEIKFSLDHNFQDGTHFGISIHTLKHKLFVGDKLLEQNTPYPVEQKTIQQTATNQIPVKEVTIIKEIVKIPCHYCSQFFDITMDKCPECGAKNTYYKR